MQIKFLARFIGYPFVGSFCSHALKSGRCGYLRHYEYRVILLFELVKVAEPGPRFRPVFAE